MNAIRYFLSLEVSVFATEWSNLSEEIFLKILTVFFRDHRYSFSQCCNYKTEITRLYHFFHMHSHNVKNASIGWDTAKCLHLHHWLTYLSSLARCPIPSPQGCSPQASPLYLCSPIIIFRKWVAFCSSCLCRMFWTPDLCLKVFMNWY